MSRKRRYHGIRTPSQDIKRNAVDLNALTYNLYYDWMIDIALARYKWNGLPDTIDVRFMEMCLIEYGSICAFREDVRESIEILPFYPISRRDNQGRPIIVSVYSPYTAYHNTINMYEKNAAICWNNFIHQPDIIAIQVFAKRISDTKRTIDVNVNGQKTPRYVAANECKKLTVQNIVGEIDMNVPTISLHDSYDIKDLQQIDLTVPYTADKLDIHSIYIWNEFLTYMGVDNANQFKQERLVSSEVNSNEANVEMSRNTNLESRKMFCDNFNQLFPEYHIDVEFNSNITKANLMKRFQNLEGDNNVNIYDKSL